VRIRNVPTSPVERRLILVFVDSSRIPKYTPQTLHAFIHSYAPAQQMRVLDHLLSRAIMVIEMLDVAELVSKNA